MQGFHCQHYVLASFVLFHSGKPLKVSFIAGKAAS